MRVMQVGSRARRLTGVLLGTAIALAGLTAPAQAADPGRWEQTAATTLPLYYYQGITNDPAGNRYFNGIYFGLYRTDAGFRETARRDDVIPPDVSVREGYSHIGDITWDEREGGRILLPLECYYPGVGDGNTCRTGSIGVADPDTLQWRYYVKLDPAFIPKAMWSEVSPDGRELWSQAGQDLLVYSMDDIVPANAAPNGPLVRPIRRLAGAVPPSGITGAAFLENRLYVAGQGSPTDRTFQIWSIDPATGERELEIEREIVGESEGVAVFGGFGGYLHWLIQPFNTETLPTYGIANGTLLSFRPRPRPGVAGEVGPPPPPPPPPPAPRIELGVTPRAITAGRLARFTFRATTLSAGRRVLVGGAAIYFDRRRLVTNRFGVATILRRLAWVRPYRASAYRRGLRPALTSLRVLAPPRR